MPSQENLIFIKPSEGLIIRDPKTRQQLPSSGKLVRNSTYWQRRIADGDVQATVQEAEE